VPNSQNSADTFNPTVTQLLEVDAELATQELQLNAQLQSIQEKRLSLKTVVDLFTPTDTTTATPIATPAQTPVAEAEAEVSEDQVEPTAEDEVTPELDQPKTDTTADTPAVPDTEKRQAKKNSSPASKKQSAKTVPTKKTSEELETWQQYLREEFSNATLATAVSEVMQQHSGQVLEIAAIVDAILVDEIPPQVRSKARERVSNVLSVGVKEAKMVSG
jgi:hypothetical protein